MKDVKYLNKLLIVCRETNEFSTRVPGFSIESVILDKTTRNTVDTEVM